MDTQVTSNDQKMILWVFGPAVEMMRLKAALLVLKWNINLQNGLTKKPRSTFMINLEDQILIDL